MYVIAIKEMGIFFVDIMWQLLIWEEIKHM